MATREELELRKLGLEINEKRIAAASSIAGLAFKAAVSVGGGLTCFYLASISFFPPGLTPGEAVFFVFIALAFGALCGVAMAYGAFSLVWLLGLVTRGLHRFRWERTHPTADRVAAIRDRVKEDRQAGASTHLVKLLRGYRRFRQEMTRAHKAQRGFLPKVARGWGIAALSLLVWLIFMAGLVLSGSGQVMRLALGATLAGFVLLVFMSIAEHNHTQTSTERVKFYGAGAGAGLLALLFFGGPKDFVGLAFTIMGIRQNHVFVELPDKEASSIAQLEDAVGVPLRDCNGRAAGKFLVHHVNVLWKGIGNQILLGFDLPRPENNHFNAKRSLRDGQVAVDAADVRILQSHPLPSACFAYDDAMLFRPGEARLVGDATGRFAKLTNTFSAGTSIEAIVVTHAPRAASAPLTVAEAKLQEERGKQLAGALAEALGKARVTAPSLAWVATDPVASAASDAGFRVRVTYAQRLTD